jgi:hypothetical protein
MKLDDLLNFMKVSISNYAAYKNCVFEPYESGQLNSNKTRICRYSGKDNGKEFIGKLIVFLSNGKTYLIIYQGDTQYNSNGTPEKIISSLKIGNLKDNQENQHSSEIPFDWTIYEIDKIGKIAIPPSMEVRDSSSFSPHVANSVKDKLPVHRRIAMTKQTILFQPKGMNADENEASPKYSRIMIKFHKGESGDFYNQYAKFSSKEKDDLNNSYKNEVESSFSGSDIKLVKWFPFDLVTIDNLNWHKISYIRQMSNNQPVLVESYRFNNDDKAIEMILSYRNSEKTIWGNDFNTIINTFRKL